MTRRWWGLALVLLLACSTPYRRALLTDQLPPHTSRARAEASIQHSGWCRVSSSPDQLVARWCQGDPAMTLTMRFAHEQLSGAMLEVPTQGKRLVSTGRYTQSVTSTCATASELYDRFRSELEVRYGQPAYDADGYRWWKPDRGVSIGLGIAGTTVREVYIFHELVDVAGLGAL